MDEFPRYRKKAKKKTPKKSDHKHVFEYCVINELDNKYAKEVYRIGCYCPVCGKIGDCHGDLERDGWLYNAAKLPFYRREWSDKALREFDANTRTLPYFEVADFFAKYVKLDDERRDRDAGCP